MKLKKRHITTNEAYKKYRDSSINEFSKIMFKQRYNSLKGSSLLVNIQIRVFSVK